MNRFWLSDETYSATEVFTVRSTIFIEGRGLRPLTAYDFRLVSRSSNDAATLLARYSTDCYGSLAATALIPCVGALNQGWRDIQPCVSIGNTFTIRAGISGSRDPEIVDLNFVVALRSKRPRIFHCDADGRLLTGVDKGKAPVSIALHNLPAGFVRVFLVPRQFGWQIGDPIEPVVTRESIPCKWLFHHDGIAKRVIDLTESRDIPAGGYQFVARAIPSGGHDAEEPFLLRNDVISDRQSASLVVRLPFNRRSGSDPLTTGFSRPPLTNRHCLKLNNSPRGTVVYAAFDGDARTSALDSKGPAIYVVRHRSPAS
jgi:hypothetical protein